MGLPESILGQPKKQEWPRRNVYDKRNILPLHSGHPPQTSFQTHLSVHDCLFLEHLGLHPNIAAKKQSFCSSYVVV